MRLRWFVCVFQLCCHTRLLSAQVQNLLFDDTDTTAGTLAGSVQWEQPASGLASVGSYKVYLTDDAVGTTKTSLGSIQVGAQFSSLGITGITKGANAFIMVYLVDAAGTETNGFAACLFDNPSSLARTVYAITTGYTKAAGARTALVATGACHAAYHQVTIEMVATAYYDGSSVLKTEFDNTVADDSLSTTARFLVSFVTPSTFSDIDTALSSYTDDAPFKPSCGDAAAAATYKVGTVRAYDQYHTYHLQEHPNPDIGHYLAISSVEYSIAGAAWVDRSGNVHILTKNTATATVEAMNDVWLGWLDIVWTNADGAAALKTNLDARVTQTTAQCYQISSDASHSSCTNPHGL